MKRYFLLIPLAFVAISMVQTSCTKDESIDRYNYIAENDTISPVLSISVPTLNQVYAYGDDVHIVGTVTDLEKYVVTNDPVDQPKAGSLNSLHIQVQDLTNGNNILLDKTPNVAGKDGYTFHEKFVIVAGTGTTNMKLIVTAEDASSKVTADSIDFSYN